MFAWSSAPLDALTAAYFMAFAVGALFSFTAWILGCLCGGAARRVGRVGGRGAGRVAARAPVPAVAPAGAARAGRVFGPVPPGALGRVCSPLLDMSAWAAMLCVGGGVGYMLRATGSGAVTSLMVALPAGLAAGYLLGALIEMLRDDARYVEPASVEGTLARVLCPIGSETTGEVVFVKAGTRRAIPAMSCDGRAIDRGTEVIVLAVASGIAKVAPARELID